MGPTTLSSGPDWLYVCLQGWSRFTSGSFSIQQVQGNHLWPLEKEAKQAWLEWVVHRLQAPALAAGLLALQ